MASPAPQRQKSVLAGLIAFGVLAILLGFVNLKRTIGPYRNAARTEASAPAVPTTREELEAQQEAALTGLDTDNDGLSDLEEFERTRTSPFLADSDSDGKSDKEEVAAETDPNCPEGQTCVAESAHDAPPERLPGAPPAPAIGDALAPLAGATGPIGDALRTAVSAQDDGKQATAQFIRELEGMRSKPSAIRTFLTASGFPKQELDALTDAQLLEVWAFLIADFQKQSSQPSAP